MAHGITNSGATLLFEHGNKTKIVYLFNERIYFFFFLSFSHVFTVVELRHLINRSWFELTKGCHSKYPSAFRSTVFQWWQDELCKSVDNIRICFSLSDRRNRKVSFKKTLQNILVEIMIVRPESPVRDMTSQETLGQTKYQEALHVAFLGLWILKCHRKL